MAPKSLPLFITPCNPIVGMILQKRCSAALEAVTTDWRVKPQRVYQAVVARWNLLLNFLWAAASRLDLPTIQLQVTEAAQQSFLRRSWPFQLYLFFLHRWGPQCKLFEYRNLNAYALCLEGPFFFLFFFNFPNVVVFNICIHRHLSKLRLDSYLFLRTFIM